MTIPTEDWSQAREQGERVLDAQRALEHATAEYHHAIRRLHLNGATVREIAAALGMSHQRVSQIAHEGSRRWTDRLRRRKPQASTTGLHCSFCERSSRKVKKLVAGPGVTICDRCLRGARACMDKGTTRSGFQIPALSARIRCSFCGCRGAAHRRLADLDERHVRICSDCLPKAEAFAFGDSA